MVASFTVTVGNENTSIFLVEVEVQPPTGASTVNVTSYIPGSTFTSEASKTSLPAPPITAGFDPAGVLVILQEPEDPNSWADKSSVNPTHISSGLEIEVSGQVVEQGFGTKT